MLIATLYHFAIVIDDAYEFERMKIATQTSGLKRNGIYRQRVTAISRGMRTDNND